MSKLPMRGELDGEREKEGIAGHRKGMCKAWEARQGREGSEGQLVCWDRGDANRGWWGVELGHLKRELKKRRGRPSQKPPYGMPNIRVITGT